MKSCNCTLPYINPDACRSCNINDYSVVDGSYKLEYDYSLMLLDFVKQINEGFETRILEYLDTFYQPTLYKIHKKIHKILNLRDDNEPL